MEQPIESPITAEERPAWQAPKLEKLHIALDTAFGPGSGIDGEGGEDQFD